MSNNLPEPYGVLFKPAPEFDEDAPEDATAALMLLEPEFKGVVFRLHTVSFGEDDQLENAVIKFNYDILSGNVPKSKIVDFEICLGNLIFDLVLEQASQEQ